MTQPIPANVETIYHDIYGNGFSHSSLTRMAKFYAYLPEQAIVATLSQQLSWSHVVELIKIEDELKRGFYILLCSDARWPERALREPIAYMYSMKPYPMKPNNYFYRNY